MFIRNGERSGLRMAKIFLFRLHGCAGCGARLDLFASAISLDPSFFPHKLLNLFLFEQYFLFPSQGLAQLASCFELTDEEKALLKPRRRLFDDLKFVNPCIFAIKAHVEVLKGIWFLF